DDNTQNYDQEIYENHTSSSPLQDGFGGGGSFCARPEMAIWHWLRRNRSCRKNPDRLSLSHGAQPKARADHDGYPDAIRAESEKAEGEVDFLIFAEKRTSPPTRRVFFAPGQ